MPRRLAPARVGWHAPLPRPHQPGLLPRPRPSPTHAEKFDAAPGAGAIISPRRFEPQLAGALQIRLKRSPKPALACAQRVFCCPPSLIWPDCGGRKTHTAKTGRVPTMENGHARHPSRQRPWLSPRRLLLAARPGYPPARHPAGGRAPERPPGPEFPGTGGGGSPCMTWPPCTT